MNFEFATATRIRFGPGSRNEVTEAVTAFGRRALLVSGQRAEPAESLAGVLRAFGVDVTRYRVGGEPTIAMVIDGVAQAREAGAQVVVALGGGSALDAGKAIAALLTNPGEALDYLETIGRGRALENDPAPFIALPTTAGTGSEVTRNAVLAAPEQRVKVSLRSPRMLARLALVDPELTYSVPPAVTGMSGLDALTQLIEPFVTPAANPFTDALCREGIPRAARALPRAYAYGGDSEARQDMALASLLSGLALANAKLGAVHGLAGPLGGWLPGAPHGALCARLLPICTAANVRALETRAPGSPAVARYAETAALLTGRPEAGAGDAAPWLAKLAAELHIPPLREYGLTSADIGALVPQAQRANSMRGNPIALTDAEVAEILEEAI
jgi:alcohol dehydrogenase class IV